jgi:hypothetical protein
MDSKRHLFISIVFFNDFRGTTNFAIFSISVNFFDLFDSPLKRTQRHTIYVGIEISTKINSKNNLFISIIDGTYEVGQIR